MSAADAGIHTLESIARQVRDPFARWEAELFRTMRALIDGPLEVAARRAEVARELGAKVSPNSSYHSYVLQRNAVLRLDGRLVEAEALVRDISMRYPSSQAGRWSWRRTKPSSAVRSAGAKYCSGCWRTTRRYCGANPSC